MSLNAKFSAGEKTTLSNAVLDQIVDLIRSGELLPGSIVNEARIAEKFQISRAPVREAIQVLESRKLVKREAYQRARISYIGVDEIRGIVELREALEGMAVRLAIPKLTDEQLVEIEEISQKTVPLRDTYLTDEIGFSFHKRIVDSCGNPRIQELLYSELYDCIRLFRWSHPKATRIPSSESKIQHWQIARAMRARDEWLAESLMRDHVRGSVNFKNL